MECAYEEPVSGEEEPSDLRSVDDGELFDPGILGSLTREQVLIVSELFRNYDIKDIAKYRSTQSEQIELAIGNIRRQTGLPLSELADLLIGDGLIEAPVPQEFGEEIPVPEEAAQPFPEVEIPAEEDATPAEDEAEQQPETGEAVVMEPERGELSPIARQQTQEYLAWMYPKENLDDMDKLSNEEIAAIADAVRVATKKYDDSLRKPRKRHVTPAAVGYMDLWLQGHGVPKIAALAGKNEGTVRLSLAPFAEKLGNYVSLDDLLRQAAEAKNP